MLCRRTRSPLRVASILTALALAACGGSTAASDPTGDEAALREGAIPLATYVVDGYASDEFHLARLTLRSATRFEADVVQRGESRFLRGSYTLFPARPNNPDSPVASDKPWIALSSEGNGPSPNFEYDLKSGGGLRMYMNARHRTFDMKRDDNWRAPATSSKVIRCTGTRAEAELSIDEAGGRAGTLKLTGKAGRTPSATVSMFLVPESQTGVRDWVRFEGSKGNQDFSFGIKKADYDRGGVVTVSANFAEDGQEFGIGFDRCEL